jgi:hypothetical protein
MDEFASFSENFVLALIAVLLLMAIWGCAIVAIDYWVWASRSDSPRGGQRSAKPNAQIRNEGPNLG